MKKQSQPKPQSKPKRERVSFTAMKIVSRPTSVKFHTKSGKEVSFKAQKDVPKSVRVNFITRKKK